MHPSKKPVNSPVSQRSTSTTRAEPSTNTEPQQQQGKEEDQKPSSSISERPRSSFQDISIPSVSRAAAAASMIHQSAGINELAAASSMSPYASAAAAAGAFSPAAASLGAAFPPARPSVPSVFELALWQRRMALEDQARLSYLQAAVARQQQQNVAASIASSSRINISAGQGVSALSRRERSTVPLSASEYKQELLEEHPPSRKRRRLSSFGAGQQFSSKPRCGNKKLKTMPLPGSHKERSISIGSLDKYQKKWDSLVAVAASVSSADEAAKRGFVKRAFSNAIHKNDIAFQEEQSWGTRSSNNISTSSETKTGAEFTHDWSRKQNK